MADRRSRIGILDLVHGSMEILPLPGTEMGLAQYHGLAVSPGSRSPPPHGRGPLKGRLAERPSGGLRMLECIIKPPPTPPHILSLSSFSYDKSLSLLLDQALSHLYIPRIPQTSTRLIRYLSSITHSQPWRTLKRSSSEPSVTKTQNVRFPQALPAYSRVQLHEQHLLSRGFNSTRVMTSQLTFTQQTSTITVQVTRRPQISSTRRQMRPKRAVTMLDGQAVY